MPKFRYVAKDSKGRELDWRVLTVPASHGGVVVMHILDKQEGETMWRRRKKTKLGFTLIWSSA